jgi:hypothetical protein
VSSRPGQKLSTTASILISSHPPVYSSTSTLLKASRIAVSCHTCESPNRYFTRTFPGWIAYNDKMIRLHRMSSFRLLVSRPIVALTQSQHFSPLRCAQVCVHRSALIIYAPLSDILTVLFFAQSIPNARKPEAELELGHVVIQSGQFKRGVLHDQLHRY